MPIGVADDRGALRSTIAHGIVKANLVQQVFHFAVEGSTTDNDLVEAATESLDQVFADFVADARADNGQFEQHLHAGRL